MTPEEIVGIGREALYMAIQTAGPILVVGLIVGLLIGIFQATTQIQEMTLVFVPKLVVMVLLLLYLGKWIAINMITYTASIFERVATISG
jgi:flagellar biosynthetic protein FliQ